MSRLAASLLLAAACAGAPRAPAAPGRLDALLDRYWEDVLVLDPIQATAIGDDRYDDQLPDFLSAEWRGRRKAHVERYRAELSRLDRARLSGQDRLSHDVLDRDLALQLEGLRHPGWMIPVHQFGDGFTFLAMLASGNGIQPFRTPKDYDAFHARLGRALPVFDSAVANMREGIRAGVVQPRVVIERSLAQLDAIAAADAPERSVLWGAVAKMPETFPAAERERITAAYRARVGEEILPAYRRLRDFLREEYLPRTRETVGLAALPGGREWYAYEVRAATTTDLSPERIHAVGLEEVARIRAQMDEVRRAVGFPGDLGAFFAHLREEPRYYFADPAALLDGYRDLQRRVNAALPRLFDVFPRADYEVREIEAFRAKSMAGAQYQPGTPDGRRPGVFYVNTSNLRAQPIFGMETLSLHEASPGHHFQISIAQEVTGLPKFRRFGGYVAYVEGWALYAESIGKELGFFADPLQWYGRLSDELLRAMRLVVDTGIHARGWTREGAIRYMLETSSMAESDVVAEVERYVAVPGQALGYKVGQLAITSLRREAEAALGARFDVKAFHREVLVDGALPLDVLEAKVHAWIAAERARR